MGWLVGTLNPLRLRRNMWRLCRTSGCLQSRAGLKMQLKLPLAALCAAFNQHLYLVLLLRYPAQENTAIGCLRCDDQRMGEFCAA